MTVITNLQQLREQGTGNREQGTGNREQGTGNRFWATLLFVTFDIFKPMIHCNTFCEDSEALLQADS
jgi:hypothetical protein